jgi:hypothetical protein
MLLSKRLRSSCLPFMSGLLACTLLGSYAETVLAQPYNPYADGHDDLAPVAADGTLRWGPFYKSAAVQKTYERLWGLGACRGTNKAITVPVERNKMMIDHLPEESFTGRVRETAGSLSGGMVAFTEGAAIDPSAAVLIAQLHPAGVTQMKVGGSTSVAALKPGMTVRLRTEVDDKGRAAEPIRAIDIVTPPRDFTPDAVRSHQLDTVVGTVVQTRNKLLLVKVDAGKIRRLTLPLADDAVVMVVDAAQIDLIAPGDEVEITGRRWSGEGAMGAGTVFTSRIVVTKAPLQPKGPAQPGPNEVGAKPGL